MVNTRRMHQTPPDDRGVSLRRSVCYHLGLLPCLQHFIVHCKLPSSTYSSECKFKSLRRDIGLFPSHSERSLVKLKTRPGEQLTSSTELDKENPQTKF